MVLITGAESGIGRAVAARAAAEGASIAAVGLDRAGLDSLVASLPEGRAAARVADVSDEAALTAAVDELVAALGPLDVAHANAAVLTQATSLGDLDLADWERVLAVNLTGVLLTFRVALPRLRTGGGVLLATGSSLAIRPGNGPLPYVAAKAGVHAVARRLALELAPQNIRVNVIAPGLAETAMTLGVPGHVERGLASVPEGRLVDIEDVAALAVHLMTDEAASITGAVFPVDQGRTAV